MVISAVTLPAVCKAFSLGFSCLLYVNFYVSYYRSLNSVLQREPTQNIYFSGGLSAEKVKFVLCLENIHPELNNSGSRY